ncbi:MAG: peptidoglycan DD-metalloendopeptidase family protein [Gammaproteobacteria bacterium]|nr:peptidoglycan DD-metalloendopeptidase family protein [Gammaproteobacteria bacterium]
MAVNARGLLRTVGSGVLAALALAAAGCAAAPTVGKAPVINKAPHRVIPATAAARAGDSIYTIAWRFGLDYQDIAEWNGLRAPYPVRAGQRLRLRAPGAATVQSAPAATTTGATVTTATPSANIPKPGAPSKPTVQPAKSAPAAPPRQWRWPAEGQLVGRFSPAKGRNGIQIAGAPGSAIRATAGGQVVYAGEGLRGYGKLLIVKHSPAFLSAYAHNRSLLVAEGARIKPGQQIARMGSSGASRVMLHFEIRKDGKPVDPLKFLN